MPRTRPPVLAARPVLRPGQLPVPRGDGRLHVGGPPLEPVLVPDETDVRRLLDDLADPLRPWRPPSSARAVRAFEDLLHAGLVVAAPTHDTERRLAGQFGTEWPARARARAEAAVALTGSAALVAQLRALLAEEGVRAASVDPADLSAEEGAPGLLVIATEGPVRRDLLDALARPHLVVSAAPQGWVVGPFVAPGRTACLRCIDAELGRSDPRLPWVLEQWARRARPGAAPLSSSLQAVAIGLAARETLAWVDGEVPESWSATLSLGPSGLPRRTAWLRHPDCSCVWDLLLSADLA